MSISSIIFSFGGFTATVVCEPNNDDFDGGNNGGDWVLKNWFWVSKNWFCEGGEKFFKVGNIGGGGGGKKFDSGGEGGDDKPSLLSLVFF